MMTQFALTPEALSEARASNVSALELGIGCLNDLCRSEGVFADMRDGDWSQAANAVGAYARRFLTFARKNRRLILRPPQLPHAPDEDEQWLWEAQRLHERFTCGAVVTHRELAETYPEAPVISIERLNRTDWWEARSPSKTVNRTTQAYLSALEMVLKHANSLMFIDAYIDPRAENYTEFPQLIIAAGANGRHPVIEIHRASWRRDRGQNQVQSLAAWMADFEPWSLRFATAGIKATVFLWERIHDRFLISDLLGINVPYGFDIATDPGDTSTWARLGIVERDRHQKEFHPTSLVHRHVGSFDIGAAQ